MALPVRHDTSVCRFGVMRLVRHGCWPLCHSTVCCGVVLMRRFGAESRACSSPKVVAKIEAIKKDIESCLKLSEARCAVVS